MLLLFIFHSVTPGYVCQNAPATGAVAGYSEGFAGYKLLEKSPGCFFRDFWLVFESAPVAVIWYHKAKKNSIGLFTLSLNNLSLRMKKERHTKAFECLFFGNLSVLMFYFKTVVKQTYVFRTHLACVSIWNQMKCNAMRTCPMKLADKDSAFENIGFIILSHNHSLIHQKLSSACHYKKSCCK